MQNPLCAAQGAVLVGLALTVTPGGWWLDPGADLAVAVLIAVREAWRGEACC